MHRFDRVQEFASYARLVKCAKESAGKKHGPSGAKIGNVHLKWAFSEAAVLFLRQSAEGKRLLARLEKRFGKGKALSVLAQKLGRAHDRDEMRGVDEAVERGARDHGDPGRPPRRCGPGCSVAAPSARPLAVMTTLD